MKQSLIRLQSTFARRNAHVDCLLTPQLKFGEPHTIANQNLPSSRDVTIAARCGNQCRADDVANQRSMIPVLIKRVNERLRIATYLLKVTTCWRKKSDSWRQIQPVECGPFCDWRCSRWTRQRGDRTATRHLEEHDENPPILCLWVRVGFRPGHERYRSTICLSRLCETRQCPSESVTAIDAVFEFSLTMGFCCSKAVRYDVRNGTNS